jgi:acyl carrier protein
MPVHEIEDRLIRGIAAIAKVDASSLPPEKPFHELGIDSLGFVEILVFIEKNFHVELLATDVTRRDFESVRSLARFIERNL